MGNFKFASIWACVLMLLVTGAVVAADPAAAFTDGQKVEVREGDTWSAATVVKKEGRKYQIQYDDGTEEWVTADRLRVPGKSADGKDAKPGDKPRKSVASYDIGASVQVKQGAWWRDAKIQNKSSNGWYLIDYEKRSDFEWVEVWRIRKPGSTYDIEGWPRNETMRKPGPPPKKNPADAPPEEGKGGGAFDAEPFDKPVKELNTSEAKDVIATAPAGTWKSAVDPSAASKGGDVIALRSGNGGTFQRLEKSVLTNGKLLLVYKGSGSAGDKTMVMERVDLAKGDSDALIEITEPSIPHTLSPSGKLVGAVARGFHGGTMQRADVWAIKGSELEHVVSFAPFGGSQWKDVTLCKFLDETHLLTGSNGGELMCLEIPSAKPIWKTKVGRSENVMLSNTGKFVFLETDEGLVCLDALTGKATGVMDTQNRPMSTKSISPSGKRLVTLGNSVVGVWDLETGKFVDEFALPPGSGTGSIDAISDRFVLINRTILVDLDHESPVWMYNGASDLWPCGDRVYYIMNKAGRQEAQGLSNTKLPHASALKAADALEPTEMLVKPGDKVTLDLSIEASDDERKRIVAALTKQLTDAGLTIADGQPIRLVARTEQGKTESRVYQRWGGFGPGGPRQEAASVTEKITRLAFEVDGKVAWETRSVNFGGGMVSIKQGQSIADAVAAGNTYNTGFLATVHVPAKVPRPVEPEKLGKSQFMFAGPKDQ